MPKFVRVRDKVTGHQFTIAEAAVRDDKHDVLKDKDAVNKQGKPLPAKPNTSASARKRSQTTKAEGTEADTPKES